MKREPLSILDGITIVLLLIAAGMVFFYAPLEAVMGAVQKIFYFHVSTAWVGMLSFLVAAGAGAAYLKTHDRRWDMLSISAVEVGMAFTLIMIITGMLWARPIWNTWWTWDPRLTTSAIMELVYAAYILLRQGIEEPERRARFGAVYAILGAVCVPLTFFSIRLFRTIHPVIIGSGDPSASGAFAMTTPMTITFITSLVTFTFIFVSLLWHRMRLAALAEQVEMLKLKIQE